MAIQLEKNAETFYREALTRVSIPILEPVLSCLADEERDHAEWFERLKRMLEEARAGGEGEELDGATLRSLVGDQKFSLADADLSEIESAEELIELAVEHEKDTILFYQMLQSFLDNPETIKELDQVIAQEEQHIKLLKECEDEMISSKQ